MHRRVNEAAVMARLTVHCLAVATAFIMTGYSTALAQEIAIDRYVPAARASDGWAISRPQTGRHLEPSALLQFDYARNPVTIESRAGTRAAIVADHLVAHLIGSTPISDRWLLFAGLPIGLVVAGSDEGSITSGSVGLGDLHAGVRVTLEKASTTFVTLALQGRLTFPTAEASNGAQTWMGDTGMTAHPEVLIELRPFDHLRFVANVGARLRGNRNFGSVVIGNEFTYGLGINAPIVNDRWRVVADVELYGASSMTNLFGRDETTLEILGGLKTISPFGLVLGAAVGPGVSRGLGTPDYRGVVMLSFVPRRVEKRPLLVLSSDP